MYNNRIRDLLFAPAEREHLALERYVKLNTDASETWWHDASFAPFLSPNAGYVVLGKVIK